MTSTQPVEIDPQSWDDLDALRTDVATLLGLTDAEDLGLDEDLLSVGLESLTLIQLVTRWRAAGIDVDFAEFAEAPTVREWARILSQAPRTGGAEPTESADPEPAEPEFAEAVGEPFPLATMQHAYWVGRQPGQPFGGVAAHFYVEFDGTGIDPERLRRAFAALVARHGMLRSRVTEDGRAMIGEVTEPRLPVRDLRQLPPAEVEERLAALRSDYTHRMMDVEAGEICEVALTLLPDSATRLHLDLDMVASDALSLRLLFEDLRKLYLASPPAVAGPAEDSAHAEDSAPPPLTYDFPRYLADRAARGDDRVVRARQWWQDRLDDLPEAPDLPLRPGAGEPTTVARSTRLDHWIDPGRRAVLTERARRHGVTPAVTLATAFAEVIGAWSAGPRFLLNLPLFDRDPLHPDVDLLVGDFSSSLLLDIDLGEPLPFAERARSVGQNLAAAIGHGSYSGVEVLRELSRRRGHPVLAPVVYTSALGLGDIYSQAVQECFGRPAWTISQGPQVWLDAQVTEHDGGLLLNWDVRLDCLGEGVAQEAFAAYRALVDRLAGSDDPWQAPVGALLPAAQTTVRAEVNATRRENPVRTLHEIVFRWAAAELGEAGAEESADGARHPAVIAGDRRLGYAELADAALRVAALLVDEGVRPGDTVVVTLPRGVEQVVAVLGVLAAGAAYLPLGVDQPPLRRAAVHARAGARLVLTDTATSALLAVGARGSEDGPRLVDIAAAAAREPLAGPVGTDPDQVAYVLFTSGSTGEPKGVEVTHAAAANTIDAINHRFGVGPRDRMLALSALDFDLSVYDLFGALAAGGAVVLLADEDRRDAAAWWRALTEHEVTVWNTVPALLDMLLTAAPAPEPSLPAARGLRLVLLGGDVVGVDLPARTRAVFPAARFVALGGMTEAAIHSTSFEVSPEQDDEAQVWPSMPWGIPLSGVRARVVDAQGRDCPDRVTGELWIGGRSVARGYRGDPARTADRFVEHAGTRWYRTGDLARYRPDGVLEFLGRADGQVKIRGHRIELGEVEAAARSHPEVAAAAATVVEGPARRLALVVQPAGDPGEEPADGLAGDPLVESLRGWLTERLPEASRPQLVAVRSELPLSRNGKVDRAALAAALTAEPATGGAGDVFTPPRGTVETAVAGIWSDLLGAERVGRDDTFVGLGGDSLLATTMLVRLREAGLAGGRLGRLFTTPRLADFAVTLQAVATPGPDGTTPPALGEDDGLVADPEHRYEPFPPTDVQRAYWIGRDERLPLGGVGTWHYTEFDVPAATWDPVALQTALGILVNRHEMLRAVFDEDGNQRILAEVPPPRVDVRAAGPGADPDAELAAFRREHSHRLLDLTRWPLFEVSALRYERAGEARVRLAVGLDYLVFDALSIMTLYTELDRLYVAARAGAHPPALPEIGVSFRDYVLGVRPDPRTAEADQEYWLARLAELPPAPALPTALDPAQLTSPRFERHRHWHSPQVWERLRAAARRHDVTVSTVLLAAYGEVLAAWSTHTDLTITLTLFDRRPVHPDIARLLGDFTTLSLADHRRADTWLATVGGLQRRLATDLDHREVSPIWLLRELARATGALEAMPVVFTSAIGVGDGVSMDLSDAFGAPVYGLSQSPQVGLDNQVVEADGGLQVSWDVVEGLFRPGVVDAMFAAYNRLVGWLADGDWSGRLPDLLPPGQRAVRAARNATAVDRAPATLHGAFFGRAVAEPDRTALVWEHPQAGPAAMSYRDLADAALRVAGGLVTRGVVPGDTVAVTLPKGPDQIAAVLGVLAAGAAYVPIGVEQPALRRARIHTTSGARYVMADDADGNAERTGGESPGWEPSGGAGPGILGIGRALAGPALVTPVPVDPGGLAYVIFTSGSTGEPKGVEIAHDAAANTVADINARYGIGAGDRVLALSALDFDLSVYDVFGLLGAGGTVVLAAEDDRRDARRWLSLVRDHGVTVWNTVPALLDMLLVASEPEPLPAGLRLALVSGDWVGLDLPGRLRARTGGRCRLVALGGATEASIWSNAFEADEVPEDWSSVPYGFPLDNQAYRVVDPRGDDRPDWVPGELWIGGRGVAFGYRGDPRRTADRFVRRAGDRWYRTGDLGRYWPDGTLEFLGRSDQQVKVGGHRIELTEVEAAMEGFPLARAGAVVAVGDRHRRALHAFVVPAAPVTDDAEPAEAAASPEDSELAAALRAHLADRLPPYAVPARVSVLPELPLTANGKIDRLALATLGEDLTSLDGVAPDPGAQSAIAALWSELLGVHIADRDANFFGAGGDSMLALRMVGALRARYGVDVPVRGFLAAPTVAGLAALVLEHGDAAVFEPDAFEEGVL